MKIAYKFDSKYLGQAFMKELRDIRVGIDEGYGQYSADCFFIIDFFGGTEKMYGFNQDESDADKVFQLETQWNEALKHAKRQIKTKFEKGKWYRHMESNAIARYNGRNGNGISNDDGWGDSISMNFRHEWKEATPDEIKSALVKEAKRRGLHENDFDGIDDLRSMRIEWKYYGDDDELYYDGKCCYQQGKWAEPQNKFFDWDVEKDGNSITIRHMEYDKKYLSRVLCDLNYVLDKSVRELRDELDKIL